MKTYTASELAEIIEKHQKWLNDEEDGERANLSSADLSSADLSYADLSHANLSYADLSYADLSHANLRSANLRSANLRSANLRSANLRSANLRSADLRSADLSYANLAVIRSMNGMVGNMAQAKSIQADIWPVTYTASHMQIGCQLHEIQEWWSFDNEEIGRMDSQALAWWAIWKPILKTIIDTSPAAPLEK